MRLYPCLAFRKDNLQFDPALPELPFGIIIAAMVDMTSDRRASMRSPHDDMTDEKRPEGVDINNLLPP